MPIIKKTPFFIYLHIFVLSAFAIAPIYNTLSEHAAFFLTHRTVPSDVIILIICLSIILPALISMIIYLATMASKNAGRRVNAFFILLLSLLVLLPVFKKSSFLPDLAVLGISIALSVLFTLLYFKRSILSKMITYACVAIIGFPILFITSPQLYQLMSSGSSKTYGAAITKEIDTPVVVIIFDEFPATSLMDRNYMVDQELYPNLAGLAAESYWFRKATTVATNTRYAVPAILTGKYPDGKVHLALLPQYPNNLFTLLSNTHELYCYETNTMLCPVEINQALPTAAKERLGGIFSHLLTIYLHILSPNGIASTMLPPIDQGFELKDFISDKAKTQQTNSIIINAQIEKFVQSFEKAKGPAFHFLHILLPHHPWVYYPSGNTYFNYGHGTRGIFGINDDFTWPPEKWPPTQSYQRHLMQLGHTDKVIGGILDKLKQNGIYEKALIVVTADHGVSFRPGENLRVISKENFADIMSVPLLIKRPFQEEGIVSDINASTIDIVPTVAEILGIELTWSADGRSLINNELPESSTKTAFNNVWSGDDVNKSFTTDANFPELFKAVDRKHQIFSDGLFSALPHKDILGKDTNELLSTQPSVYRVRRAFQGLGPKGGDDAFIDGHIVGHITNIKSDGQKIMLAASADGRIEAVSQSLGAKNGSAEFSFIMPDMPFREVQILEVVKGAQGVRLKRIISTRPSEAPYRLINGGGNDIIEIGRGQSGGRKQIPLSKRGGNGALEKAFEINGGQYFIIGWTGETKGSAPISKVLVFIDKTFIFAIENFEEKPELAQVNGVVNYRRFKFPLPQEATRRFKDGSKLRVFSLSKEFGVAELPYGPKFFLKTPTLD